MKTTIATLFVSAVALISSNALATIYVPSPPGNIVQNGTFQTYGVGWVGNMQAYVHNPNAPNGVFGLITDIYQNIPTTTGQQYFLDFYAAADVLFGSTVAFSVVLSHQTLNTYTTSPFTPPGGTRYDQMQWDEFTSSFTASASTTRLEFSDLNTYDFGLAAVSVVPIPEPKSTLFILVAAIVLACGPRWRGQEQPIPREAVRKVSE